MAKRSTSQVGGFTVKHSPDISKAQVTEAVSMLASEKRLLRTATCPIIVFGRGPRNKRTGAPGRLLAMPVAVQRCEGKSLKTGAKARFAKRVKAKQVCTKKKGKKILFAKCR